MPRSVTHELTGPHAGVEIRVWERRTEGSMHAIVEGEVAHRCDAGIDHAVTVEARWDIPAGATRWHELATRARDHDVEAAQELGAQMVDETLRDAWDDPCEASGTA